MSWEYDSNGLHLYQLKLDQSTTEPALQSVLEQICKYL